MPTHPRSYKPRPDKHKVWSGAEADAECPTIGGFTMINCEDCGARYAVHCLKCNIQVTNCSCTAKELFKRIEKQNAEQDDKEEWMKEKGVWVPPAQRFQEPKQ